MDDVWKVWEKKALEKHILLKAVCRQIQLEIEV